VAQLFPSDGSAPIGARGPKLIGSACDLTVSKTIAPYHQAGARDHIPTPKVDPSYEDTPGLPASTNLLDKHINEIKEYILCTRFLVIILGAETDFSRANIDSGQRSRP
jgi:hypothetical protein